MQSIRPAHDTNDREDQPNRSPTHRRSWFSTSPNRISSSPTTRRTTFKSTTCRQSFASSERSASWTSWADRLLTAVKTSDALLLAPTLNSSSLSLNSWDTHGYQRAGMPIALACQLPLPTTVMQDSKSLHLAQPDRGPPVRCVASRRSDVAWLPPGRPLSVLEAKFGGLCGL